MFQSSRHSGVFPAGLPVSENDPGHVLALPCTGYDGVSLSSSPGTVPMVACAVGKASEGGDYRLVKGVLENPGAAAAAHEACLAGPSRQRGEPRDGDERIGPVEAVDLRDREGERGPHLRRRKDEGPTREVGEPLSGRLVGDSEPGADSEGFPTDVEDGCCPQAPVGTRDGLRMNCPRGVLGQRLDAAWAGRGSSRSPDDAPCHGGTLARADRLPGMADAAAQKKGKAA